MKRSALKKQQSYFQLISFTTPIFLAHVHLLPLNPSSSDPKQTSLASCVPSASQIYLITLPK